MKQSVTKSLVWSFFEQGGSKAAALVVQIVLARLLSPEAFGLMALLLVVTSLADSIAQSGLGMALVQKKEATDNSFTTAFWLSLFLASALFVLIFLAAPSVASLYGMPELTPTLRVLSIVVIFNAANSIQRSYLQRTMNFKALCIVSIVGIVLSGVFGICLAMYGFGVWALVAQVLSQGVFVCLVMLKVVPWRPTLYFSRQEAYDLFSYGWKVCVSGLLGTAYDSIADLVIGKSCSAEQLGFYSQGKKWPHAGIAVVSNSLNNVFFPVFAGMQDDSERLRAGVRRALRLGSFITIPMAFLLAAMAQPLIVVLLTEKWLPSLWVFQLICLGDCFMVVRIVNLRAYMAKGYSDIYLKLQAIKVAIGIASICVAAIVTADINYVALTRACVSVLTVWAIDLRPAKRLIGYGRVGQFTDILRFLTFGVIAYAASSFFVLLSLPDLVVILLQVIAFTGIYGIGCYCFEREVLYDALGQVKSLFRRGGTRKGGSR